MSDMMINYRELLELAAKAAGWVYLTNGQLYVEGLGNCEWNPLTDDGDALRLARACKMAIDFKEGTILYYVGGECIGTDFTPGNDEEEALAILKAAAEIGRNMK